VPPSPLPPLRGVLLDAGGTLIHVDGRRFCEAAGVAWRQPVFDAAENRAVEAVQKWVRTHPASTDAERLPLFLDTLLAELGVPPADRPAAARSVVTEHRRANLWSSAYSDAPSALAALRERGYRLGVISNADGRVRRLLEEAGLSRFLDVVVDSAEAGVEKPDPRIFLAATDALGLPPGQCAYVGDIYEIDVIGARAAGLEAILIGPGEAPEGVRRVATLTELVELLGQGQGSGDRGQGLLNE
jgi:putative hydrolase of the HAD superfamily